MEKIWYVTCEGRGEYAVRTLAVNEDMPGDASNMRYPNGEEARRHAERLAGRKAIFTTIPAWARDIINEVEGDDAFEIRQCYIRH